MKNIKKYEIVNEEKWNRAIFGAAGKEGRMTGGVGEEASEEMKLAEYDRLGGLIRLDGKRIKMGSFYDFKNRKPRENPEITFLFQGLDGEVIELDEKAEIPLEVKAAELIKKKRAKKKDEDEE